MRVIVDASAAANQGAGIGRYARMVLPGLAAQLPHARLTALLALDRGADEAVRIDGLKRLERSGFRMRHLPFDRRLADILWFRARLPLPAQVFGGRADCVYSPDFTAPPSWGATSITTVHDLAFEITPQFAPDALRSYLSNVVPRQVNRAAMVAVVSETTSRDLQERYKVDPDRIAVISNGVDERFFNAPPLTPNERQALGIPEQYLLMVGTIEPRKNHLGALRAFARSRAARDLPLVIAGRRGWNDRDIIAEIMNQEQDRRVIWLDYVPERLLPSLYAGAAVTLYPSWYEGFGLPALEALASGSPLVISTAPALIEVAGNLGQSAAPDDIDGLAAAIDHALTHDRTPGLREARRQRAESYRWEQPARHLANLITRIVG
jgi:glycosyltransferase involved in cell wall biosynthesis